MISQDDFPASVGARLSCTFGVQHLAGFPSAAREEPLLILAKDALAGITHVVYCFACFEWLGYHEPGKTSHGKGQATKL